MSKPCEKGKIRNPDSNRCVARDGKIGQKILQQIMSGELKSPKKIPKKGETKSAPSGKILNPKTNRYVDVNGAIGKKILGGKSKSAETKKETKKQKDMEYSKYTKDTFPQDFSLIL